MDLYDGQTFDLKIRVIILMRMDVFPVEYGTISHMFHLIICFFWYVTAITLMWNGVKCLIVDIFVWIGICN